VSDEQRVTGLSNEAASEIVRELVGEERIKNADVLAYQLSSWLPSGPAAVFETNGGRRRFALVLHEEDRRARFIESRSRSAVTTTNDLLRCESPVS
jgi:hypothetical protein